MSEDRPIFCGSGKKVQFNNGGHLIRLSLTAADVETMAQHLNEQGWVNVNVCENRHPTEKGNTHHAKIDTWQPKEKAGENDRVEGPPLPNEPPPEVLEAEEEETDNLPF